MYSPEDRTAKAIIRDTAVELFAQHGAAAVPLRQVATASGVSQALVIKHYGSREGLVAAADAHVLGLLRNALAAAAVESTTGPGGVARSVAEVLGPTSITGYLARLLAGDGERSRQAYGELAAFASTVVAQLDREGLVERDVDREQLATVLLAHDLSLLLLRSRIAAATGTDPLTDGLEPWLRTVSALYGGRALLPASRS